MLIGFDFFVVEEFAVFDASEQERKVAEAIRKSINAFIVLVLDCFFNILRMHIHLLKTIRVRQFPFC